MAFDLLKLFDQLRHTRDQARADVKLPSQFPALTDIPRAVSKCEAELRDVYDHYVANVSSPDMAMSLELAAFLLGLCQAVEPKKILDLGSGFSSFVFRTYAAQCGGQVSVTSVDDSPPWLERTREFLAERGLSTERLSDWNSFIKNGRDTFDLIFHDLGSMETRAEALPLVLDMASPAGLVILDDVHKRSYERVVRRVTRRRQVRVFSLRSHTLDKYGRFSSLALPRAYPCPPPKPALDRILERPPPHGGQ